MRTVCIVGGGAVGTALALACQEKGFWVTLIADQLPGDGHTANMAAGIGCVFRPSSELVGRLVLDSYPTWMELARSRACPAVRPTVLRTIIGPCNPSWSSTVSAFRRVAADTVTYETYSFDPAALGRWRIARFYDQGGILERRPLSAEEVNCLQDGHSLPGIDYTVDATGLRLRSRRLSLSLYPIRCVLVHFAESEDPSSDMDEENCLYRVSRPNGVVLGGTFDRFVETCSDSEQSIIGQRIVSETNRRFGLEYEWSRRTRVTVGYQPAVIGEMILEFGPKVAYVNGLGGQGWVTSPALSRLVVGRVQDLVGAP